MRLARDLIATNSENPPGREADAVRVLKEHMEAHGLACREVGRTERPNLIISSGGAGRAQLVLHGHLDTVPAGAREFWSHDPFESEIVNGRLYGRGACDMKGPMAALAEALIEYSKKPQSSPLLMLATSDEESGCMGAEDVALSGQLAGTKFGVCAEPTNLEVLVGERGMLWTRVSAVGKAAHGSRPETGLNAINVCMDALRVLIKRGYAYEADHMMGRPTINIGTIKGGIRINVVPDQCEALVDMRLVKGQEPDSVLGEMRDRLDSAGLSERVSVEYVFGKPPVKTPPDSEIVAVAVQAVRKMTGKTLKLRAATFGTDCSVLQPKVGIISVICGPGSIEQAHQPDEYISVSQLLKSVDVYLAIARHFGT